MNAPLRPKQTAANSSGAQCSLTTKSEMPSADPVMRKERLNGNGFKEEGAMAVLSGQEGLFAGAGTVRGGAPGRQSGTGRLTSASTAGCSARPRELQ